MKHTPAFNPSGQKKEKEKKNSFKNLSRDVTDEVSRYLPETEKKKKKNS